MKSLSPYESAKQRVGDDHCIYGCHNVSGYLCCTEISICCYRHLYHFSIDWCFDVETLRQKSQRTKGRSVYLKVSPSLGLRQGGSTGLY